MPITIGTVASSILQETRAYIEVRPIDQPIEEILIQLNQQILCEFHRTTTRDGGSTITNHIKYCVHSTRAPFIRSYTHHCPGVILGSLLYYGSNNPTNCSDRTSIAVYRLYLHPLHRFPGVWYARLSKLGMAYHSSTGLLHQWLPELHKKVRGNQKLSC